ncbi:MAG: CRISPR-associated endoribonuclease Cas2 [Candidatus Micrarchaeota archaeon]|nr:MAG: CRISPR-associated endoribonuclease Cas2 [Candidatus Micrarchaeota archaeon]
MFVIVVYDISSVRLQGRIRNFLRRFLNHIQLSVFDGELDPSQAKEIELFLKDQNYNDGEYTIMYTISFHGKVDRNIFGKPKDLRYDENII